MPNASRAFQNHETLIFNVDNNHQSIQRNNVHAYTYYRPQGITKEGIIVDIALPLNLDHHQSHFHIKKKDGENGRISYIENK